MIPNQRPAAGPMGQFPDIFKNYFTNLDEASQGFDPIYKGFARLQLESIGFWSRRAQAYLEVPSRLAQCRTPHDLMNEQMRFWQTAAQQYSESANRMTSAWMQMFTAPMAAMQNGAKAAKPARDYITFPEPAREPAAASAPIDARTQRERRVA